MNKTYSVTMRGTLPDGTILIVEDWHEVYPGLSEPYNVVAYPVSRHSLPGAFSPKAGETFRCAFSFPTMKAAETVFNALSSGKAALENYVEYLEEPKYKPCVLGRA